MPGEAAEPALRNRREGIQQRRILTLHYILQRGQHGAVEMSVGHRGTPVESGGLCLSLPDELHAQPAPVRLPVESVAQPAYQMQPLATETIGAELDLQRLLTSNPAPLSSMQMRRRPPVLSVLIVSSR